MTDRITEKINKQVEDVKRRVFLRDVKLAPAGYIYVLEGVV